MKIKREMETERYATDGVFTNMQKREYKFKI